MKTNPHLSSFSDEDIMHEIVYRFGMNSTHTELIDIPEENKQVCIKIDIDVVESKQ